MKTERDVGAIEKRNIEGELDCFEFYRDRVGKIQFVVLSLRSKGLRAEKKSKQEF